MSHHGSSKSSNHSRKFWMIVLLASFENWISNFG